MSLHRYPNSNHNRKGENSYKSINTFGTMNSAYDRIFSSKNIMTRIIPGFLVQKEKKEGITSFDILKLSLAQKRKEEKEIPELEISNTSLHLKYTEDPNDRLKINIEKLNEAREIEKIMQEIVNPTLSSEEIILKIHNKSLTRGDLLCFKEGSDLPDKVIDCFFSALRISNRFITGKKTIEKVIVVNSNSSKLLFLVRKDIPKPNIDIYQYSLLLFPIFLEYWKLLAVNLNTGVVQFFDGLKLEQEVSSFMALLRRFLAQANFNNDPRITESFFRYEPNRILPVNMSIKDSGVYICKIAEMLTQKRECTNFDFRNQRKDMLSNLIKISLKLVQ
ncbi:hypothetical protein SteCoe_1927 [Stentor coeruleus]|uniref:Ubiquitin-like protease family profile domain-containing protein n=1 Tax=Stentor coeruleus TaxID=5963 RepID=A0A1R2D0G2_9CILI|nr:hypothetical protein SteCoe_1927 [Stentor coeruleus]